MAKTNNLSPVIFKQMPLELETEMFFEFLDTNWSPKITKEYPEFIPIQKIKEKEKRIEDIKKTIIQIREELSEKMHDTLINIKGDWQKIEEKCLKTLSEIMNIDWPSKEITAYISINPICPRFLNTWSFSVSPNNKKPNMIIAHEVSHFLYFKKFSEVFPKIKKEKYEFPNKEWLLSEIITPIILNDTRMKKILGGKDGYYEEHRDLKMGDKLITEIIEDLYKNFVVKQNNFSTFIKSGLKIIRKQQHNSKYEIELAKKFASKKFAETGKKNHYLDVFTILQDEFNVPEQDVLIAGLLHDTLEDTSATYKEIEETFSKQIADLVQEVSHPKNYTQEEKIKYYEDIKKISDRAKLIKMADFTSHLRNFIKIYERKEQHLYPKFVNNDKYIASIREFLESCKESIGRNVVYDLTNKLEDLL